MGVLRGFDQFMNLVLDGTVDTKTKADIGMVVGILIFISHLHHCLCYTCLSSLLACKNMRFMCSISAGR